MKKISTLFAAFFAATSLFAAADIYEIRPFKRDASNLLHEYVPSVNSLGQNDPYTTESAPLDSGELYFNVRLVTRRDGMSQMEAGTFQLVHPGTGEAVDWVVRPPKIGISVGGRPEVATMVLPPTRMPYNYSATGDTEYLFDMVFKYTIKPGDIGLPIVLVDSAGKPIDPGSSSSTATYQTYNIGSGLPWQIKYYDPDGNASDVGFSIAADRQMEQFKQSSGAGYSNETERDFLTSNYSLKDCGFYVQTVDFDRNAKRNPGWQTVREGRENEGTYVEIIDGELFATNQIEASELYVWAVSPEWLEKRTVAAWDANTPSVELVGKSGVEVTIGYTDTGDPITRTVTMATVEMKAGALYGRFGFTGRQGAADDDGTEATLVMSSSPDFNFMPSGAMTKNFVTCNVTCVKGEPELSLSRTESTDVYTVTSDYTNSLTTMTLSLSDAYTEDITVTITPNLTNPGGFAVSNVIRIAGEETKARDRWKETGPLTIKIPATKTGPYVVYVYGMGASANENVWTDGLGQEVTFDLKVDKGTSFIKHYSPDDLYLRPAAPVVENLAELTAKSITGGDEISVVMRDNYTNRGDTNTGYKITAYWYRKGEEPPTKITDKKVKTDGFLISNALNTATYKPDSSGELTALKNGVWTVGELPMIPSDVRGDYLRLWITAPNTAQTSYFDLTIDAKPTATATAYADDGGTEEPYSFPEIVKDGDPNCYVGVTLETPLKTGDGDSKHCIYAFLEPMDSSQTNLVSGSCIIINGAASQGMTIRENNVKSSLAAVRLLDGVKDNTMLQFKVVLCKTQKYDATKLYTKYDTSEEFDIYVSNVKPTIAGITMNGGYPVNLETKKFADDAEAVKGINNTFTFDISDALCDLAATNANEKFTLEYQFTGCSPKYAAKKTYRGNPDDLVVTNLFKSTGVCTLTVTLLKDKDGGKTGPFAYTFNVVDKEYITISSKDDISYFSEDEYPDFQVALSKNPADVDLTVELTVTPSGDGKLIGGGDFTNKVGAANVYLGTYKPDETNKTFSVTQADGTKAREKKSKFSFTAKVITDSTRPDSDTKWSEYFASAATSSMLVKNVNPFIYAGNFSAEGVDVVVTNTASVAMGSGTELSLTFWDVISDISNITVTVTDPDNKSYPYTVSNETQVVTHSPNFTAPGLQRVTVTAKDKDEGKTTLTIWYTVDAAKMMNVWAVGPGVGAGNKLTARYNTAGRGKGHIYVNGITPTDANRWNFEYNCGLESYVNVWAQGYCAGDVDDGTITRGGMKDFKINPNGGIVIDKTTPKYYEYPGEFDSFFYCWIQTSSSGDDGEDASALIGVPNPLVNTNDFAQAQVTLPTEADDKTGAYMPTTVEAVFSEEYLTTDNIGDINADGIPDIYALGYTGFGISAEEGTDTTDLSAFNDDGDYLPFGLDKVQTSFIFMPSNNWTENSKKFHAKLEIRGYDEHLNDAWQVLSKQGYAGSIPEFNADTGDRKATYSVEEYDAWLQAGSPEDWSPERPSDPTKADTDGDTMPDGYEYYIWYKAHVGWFDNNNVHKYLTGRKYNPADPYNPIEITSETLASIYDPISYNGDFSTRDTDDDGLTDYAEMVLGTNPFDYDTDGDGLPDGYEVAFTETDPCDADSDDNGTQDGEENADNDAMAEYSVDMLYVSVLGANNKVERYCCAATNAFTVSVATNAPATGVVFRVLSGGGATTNRYLTAKAWQTYKGDDGKERLTVGYTKSNTWICKTNDVGQLYRGEPVSLDVGTLVDGVDEKAEYYNLTVQGASLANWYVAFPYGGENTFARGEKKAYTDVAGKPVIDSGSRSIHWIHYTVYEGRGHAEGYDPRTGWMYPPEGSVDSSSYTHMDEFLSMVFFHKMGTLTEADMAVTPQHSRVWIWENYSTHPLNADTDDDKMPDGWELYLMAGTQAAAGPTTIYSPLYNFNRISAKSARDNDLDQLEWPQEYSGVSSSARYGWSPSQANWRNKSWPTDPWNEDTDGDGLKDGYEGGNGDNYYAGVIGANFFYNTSGRAGGGLNPLSWDTDGDHLPDPWEAEFHGTYNATASGVINTAIQGSTNTSSLVTGNRCTWNMDGMDGTVGDARLDYDGDGLANWQEYMTGTMRCWRYDDIWDTWGVQTATGDNLPDPGTDEWNQYWYDRLVDTMNVNGNYNPHLANGYFDPGMYMSRCRHAWDGNAYNNYYYFKDGVDHNLASIGFDNPAIYTVFISGDAATYTYSEAPNHYICTDPRVVDSDGDGMDDFYELFHGMNPLLGLPGQTKSVLTTGGPFNAYDIVHDAYARPVNKTMGGASGAGPTALNNWWCNSVLPHRAADIKHPELDGYDFIAYPWLNGIVGADPDGDNIINQEEAIMPKVQAASTYHHSDPTPLWMTDTAYTNSLTRKYFRNMEPDGEESTSVMIFDEALGERTFEDPVSGQEYNLDEFPGFTYDGTTHLVTFEYDNNPFSVANGWMWNFEENEGYDSDHDYLSDYEEGQGKTKNASDPLNHDDPLRRQAMYFNGKDAFLQLPVAEEEETVATRANGEARQNFLYYTVECWAKPDKESLANDNQLRTLVERAVYADNASAADETLMRKNFLIGVKNGRWYTCFDSTGTDKQPVEIANGPEATTNWTHVAATFDGEALRLYVNGVCNNNHATSIQPEHGVAALALSKAGEMNPTGHTTYFTSYCISILVGASAETKEGLIFDSAWRFKSYQYVDAVTNPDGLYTNATTLADYGNFYKGYIDEVRIWDGARSAADIQSDVDNRTRYTLALAAENRQAVYNAWKQGGLRSPSSDVQLPAELMYHWAFDHIAGAVLPEDVVKVPAGFNTAKSVLNARARWSRPADYVEKCWASTAVKSTVYTDNAWVPWINNTVSHLPRLDETTLDSVYWSEDYAGYAPVGDYGYTRFGFPRTAEVYSRRKQQTYGATEYYDSHRDPYFDYWNGYTTTYQYLHAAIQDRDTRWHAAIGYDATYTNDEAVLLFRFTSRNRNVSGDDLLPMGGVYPRRISQNEGGMWDNKLGQSPSASDAWAQTGNDADGNGLPDWWEEYARANYCQTLGPKDPLEWDTTVRYRNGMEMPAYEAYLRDLAAGLVKIGNKIVRDANYADTRDNDSDGLPDWWEEMYGLDTSVDNGDDDPDNDGLSNYQEYMLGEYYLRTNEEGGFAEQLQAAGVDLTKINLSPNLAYSTPGQVVPDYFLRYSDKFADITNSPSHFFANEYFGEIATDHDFMEDWWEQLYSVNYTNSKKYDPSLDKDGDGWSTWAECRASLWGAYFTADLISKWTGTESTQYVPCYPQPIIGVKATYFGNQDISGKQLVVRTTSGQRTRTDATFVIPPTLDGQTRYIGGFEADKTMHGHLSPGLLNVNSVSFDRARVSGDKVYTWNCDWYKTNEPENGGWDSGTYDGVYYSHIPWKGCSRTHTGSFEEYKSEYETWPRIEMEGGDFSWETFVTTTPSSDLDSATIFINGTTKFGWIDCTTGEYELDMSKFTGEGSVDEYVFRVTYTSRLGHEWPQAVYVSDTKELELNGTGGIGDGYVREGKNTIEAFIDLDADGAFTEGEPYGVVQNVDVGWHKVPVTVIELKDTSHVVPRINLASSGGEDGEGATSGQTKTVKIRRVAINGQTNETTAAGVTVSVPKRTLATKTLVLDSRSYLTEADVLGNAKFDLDSRWLVRDAVDKLGMSRSEITDATYEIFEVQSLADGSTSNVVLKTFTNTFNPQRVKPAAVSPVDAAPVYASSPTLAFSSSDETMTAYRLQIRRKGEKGKCVYDSGDGTKGHNLPLLPGRVPNTAGAAVYEITPPVYAGARVCSGAVTSEIFDDSADYEWRVALFNAKFNEIEGDDDWSDWAGFQMDVANVNRYPKQATGYGSASVAVRYYGPTNMTENASNIWVEAFENADFRGQPVARATLGTAKLIADYNDTTKTNALLRGLAPNTYYFRAFIDFNKNGQRDDWESWGYLNYVGKGMKAIYNPKPFVVTAATAEFIASADADFTIYIEDCDTNQNEYPDIPGLDPNLDTEGGSTATDSDGDGIADSEEETYGTDPALWDTDNDGMPDGYEALFADTDPTLSDAEECVAGDVMAFAKIAATFVTITNGEDAVVYMLAEGQAVPNVGDSAKGLVVRTTYTYPVWEDGVIVEYLGVGTNLTLTTEAKIQTVSEDGTAVLVHAQVYDEFGYDPTTATTDENAANTKEFTALDKFLVVRYLEALGLASEKSVNKNRQWSDYTLQPYNLDYDGDGIADGWELYVMFGPDGAGSETLAKAKISPWKYDDARNPSPDSAGTANAIRLIDEYDGGSSPTDPWNVDTDGDGVSDYYACKYHLKGGDSGADYDGDGLSNYAEYLISEVFKFAMLDPDNAKTDGSCVDYFRKYGDLYFGEIFTDHDQVSDVWEQKYAHHVGSSSDLYANRDIYDPSADRDDDGWSNYAEAQAGTSPENITTPGIDGEILKEYPVPAIRAKVAYRGHSVLSAPLIFQAWSEKTDPGMTSTPDAAWRAASDEVVTNVTKYIGVNPGTTRSYYLGTGAVSPGSVRIDFRDMAFERATVFNGEEVAGKTVAGEVGDSKWFYFVQDRDGVLYTSATNLTAATPVKVGTIDYATGYMTVDFGCEALQGVAYDFSINGDSGTETDAKSTAVYSNCDKLNLSRSYVKIAWQPVKTDTTGNATYYLSDCTSAVANKGHVCEGKSKFVVFSDTDENGAYTPGEPFGFVGGVDVGWQGGAFEVELTETSPIFARVDLTSTSDPTTDRVAFQAGNSAVIDVEDAQKLFKSDTTLRIYGEDTGYGDDDTGSESSTSGSSESRYVRVRVVRALVDGSDVLGKNSNGDNVYVDRAVVMDKYLDLGVRGYIHEGDFLSTNSFDVGWSDLQEKVYSRDDDVAKFIDATNITYMIVMGEGSYTAGGSNTVFRSLISRRYDSVADRQGGFIKPVIDAKQPGYVYGAKPTFRWAMQDKNGVSHNSYTAFKLQIRSGSTVVYDSGYRCAPARGSDGWYEWTLADPLGSVIKPGEEYTWRVAMFNAKFRDDTFWVNKAGSTVTTWSDSGAFVVDMNQQQEMNDHGYSTIAAAVKYAGPSCVLTKGKVIVQAFETADFADDPMGESFVTGAAEITNTAHVVANARVLGLPVPEKSSESITYYLRAFIDSNNNGVKDDWESWGAANEPATISTANVTCPTVGIYIEDADTDGDWIPDAYEYVKKGNLTALGPEVIGGDTIVFSGTASSTGTAGISTGLTGASLTIFQNKTLAGVNTLLGESLSKEVSIDDIRKAVEKKIKPDTVKITALTLAPDGSKVTLALSAEVTDSIAGELLGKVYDISNLTKETVTVTVKIYKKDTLAEKDWKLASTQSVTFDRDEPQVDVTLKTPLDMKSGFYKVEIVQ